MNERFYLHQDDHAHADVDLKLGSARVPDYVGAVPDYSVSVNAKKLALRFKASRITDIKVVIYSLFVSRQNDEKT